MQNIPFIGIFMASLSGPWWPTMTYADRNAPILVRLLRHMGDPWDREEKLHRIPFYVKTLPFDSIYIEVLLIPRPTAFNERNPKNPEGRLGFRCP